MSIYMLQEVHCSTETSDLWSTEWGYHSLFCSFSRRKSGVCILFNNNFELKVLKTFMDNEGRYILCDMMANGKNITLVNLYAPNDDNPNFFNTLFTHLLDFQCEEIIIGGDFNLVLDIEKGKSGGLARTHLNAKKVVNDFCENMDLVDAWRILNSDISRFTWRQKHPEVHCRLDFFLVSQSILGNVTRTDITPGFQTDHSMISLNISSHTNKRGPGFWKLNTSLLNEEIYVNLMKETIRETQEEYKDDASVSPTLLWDVIKLKYVKNLLSLLRKKNVKLAINKLSLRMQYPDWKESWNP